MVQSPSISSLINCVPLALKSSSDLLEHGLSLAMFLADQKQLKCTEVVVTGDGGLGSLGASGTGTGTRPSMCATLYRLFGGVIRDTVARAKFGDYRAVAL